MASVAGCPYYLIFPRNVLAKRRQPQDKIVAIGIGRGKEAHCLRMTLMNQHYQCCYNPTYFYVLKTYRFGANSQLLIYKNTISLFLVGQDGNDLLRGGAGDAKKKRKRGLYKAI